MVFYWLSWLAIVCFSLVDLKMNRTKRLLLWLVLVNIIFINQQLELGSYTVTIPYLYCLVIFWALILLKTMTYFNYYFLLCLILSYNGLKYILIINPIWLLVDQFLIIAILFATTLVIFIRNTQERIYLLMVACLTGEWLYAYNMKVLNWSIVLGESELFTSLYIAIFILYLVQVISNKSTSIHI
ncbi:MAG TPA: hypothetical protein GXZ58_08675 [Bacilli bacterium]|nr:hypothetical protein [Bacilli bacterium]